MSDNNSPVCEKSPPTKGFLPPWKVILHNDDYSVAEDVVKRVREILHLEEEDAVIKVFEAHETGCSLLVTTHQEKAEFFVDQFLTYKITVTAEKE